MIRFFNFFLDHMVQKYQNEIPPIFYYGISTKTSEKDLKIPNLQALTLGRIIKITLYIRWISDLDRHGVRSQECGSTPPATFSSQESKRS